jgi:hypothetical protein
MKHKLFILGALLLLLTVTSCRQESDALYSYGQNDELRFQEANESYAGEFKLFWHAMNQNYALWDYEREFGLDWDAVYDAFLPRFEALDQRLENGEEITDEEYQSLLEDLVRPLHDSHMFAIFKNHATGNDITADPSVLRIYDREDINEAMGFYPDLSYYRNEGRLSCYMSASTIADSVIDLHPDYAEVGIEIKSGVIDDGVAYLYFSNFRLSAYLRDWGFFASASQRVLDLNQAVVDTWINWFSMIQEMKENGTLKGVIIDVRDNSGGNVPDFHYVIGALIPQGSSLQIGYHREKNGVGRYDYGPLLPDVRPSLSDPHETITEPIVVLTNCLSVSMSEVTAMSAKTLSNGRVVGKRSLGALGGLVGGPESYSYTYAGCIGEEDKTPVYVYLPICASFSMDKKSYEGVGVEPDIEVDFDKDLFTATGRDTQLERALQYIETGN